MNRNIYYQYYQPNDKDPKRHGSSFGDCTIRALSKALGLSWLEAFDVTIPFCRKYQTSNIFNMPPKFRNEVMLKLGFYYTGVSNAKGSKRPTVASFAKEHPSGTYILSTANHIVTVDSGYYWDSWDSGSKAVYGYYTYSKALAPEAQ